MSIVPMPIPAYTPASAPRKPVSGELVRLRPWSPAEKREALVRLLTAVQADPRGGALAKALRQSIAKY